MERSGTECSGTEWNETKVLLYCLDILQRNETNFSSPFLESSLNEMSYKYFIPILPFILKSNNKTSIFNLQRLLYACEILVCSKSLEFKN